MVSETDLAWRVLEITALALPALGILLQVIAHLDWEGYDSTPHQYQVSSAMLFLIGPMTLVGLISAGVIAASYDILWIKGVTVLMALSFLFVPLILISVYRRARVRNVEFLDRQKDAIEKATETGEIPKDEAEDQIEQIEVWQDGFFSYTEWRLDQIQSFLQRRPLLSLGLYGSLLILGLSTLRKDPNIWGTFTAGWLVLYSIFRIAGHFISFPSVELE